MNCIQEETDVGQLIIKHSKCNTPEEAPGLKGDPGVRSEVITSPEKIGPRQY